MNTEGAESETIVQQTSCDPGETNVLTPTLQAEQDPAEARQFYISNLKEMSTKSKVGWPDRKYDEDVDALQHAMDLYFDDPAAFLAEFNNDPKEDLAEGQIEIQKADQLIQRTNGYERGQVPAWATKLTSFIDVQQDCLFWIVCAWSDEFRGAVIDYGVYPEQTRSYFTKLDLTRTLRKVLKEKSHQAALKRGMEILTTQLMARDFTAEDGTILQIERLALDASYEQTLVYSFCRSYGDSRVTPYHGKYIGATTTPIAQYKCKPGEKIGHHWLRPSVRGQKLAVRHYVADVNFWKSFVHSRLLIELGVEGDLSLFGKKKDQRGHRCFADHLAAQKCVRADAGGRKVDEWKRQPGKDHDWFDCLVGSAVLACVEGSQLPEWNRRKKRKRKAKQKPQESKTSVSF
jgi:phage terminase large subunit GpA-like protein